MKMWSREKKDWCCQHWAPLEELQPVQVLSPDDLSTFVSVSTVVDDYGGASGSGARELSVAKGEVLRVYSRGLHEMAYAIKHDGTTGLVPDRLLRPARVVLVACDYSSADDEAAPRSNITVKVGDAVWMLSQSGDDPVGFAMIYAHGRTGFVPDSCVDGTRKAHMERSEAPLLVAQKTLGSSGGVKAGVLNTAALAIKDFHACAVANHTQLAVQRGDMVWIANDRSSAWTYASNTVGATGWVPGSVLLEMQPALVLQAFRASREGHYFPQLSVAKGDIVWLTDQQEPGWAFAYSQKHAGWIPDAVLRPASGVPAALRDLDSSIGYRQHQPNMKASLIIWGVGACVLLAAVAVGLWHNHLRAGDPETKKSHRHRREKLPSSPRELREFLGNSLSSAFRPGRNSICIEDFRGLPPSESQVGQLDLCV